MLFGSSEAIARLTYVGYEGEIVQHVATQKLIAATGGLINTCTKLSTGLSTCLTCTRFSSNRFIQIYS